MTPEELRWELSKLADEAQRQTIEQSDILERHRYTAIREHIEAAIDELDHEYVTQRIRRQL